MAAPYGKWASAYMLSIIQKTVQHQPISSTERADLYRFLDIDPPPPGSETLLPSTTTSSRPPSYTEDPAKGHTVRLPFRPLAPDQSSDAGSSLRKTSTHGTNDAEDSGLGSAVPSSPSRSLGQRIAEEARTGRQSTETGRGSRDGSSGSRLRGREEVERSGDQEAGARDGEWDPGLLVPDPEREGDR